MNIRSAIAGNFLAGMLGRIIGAFGPIVLVPLMIRSWGLETYGEWLILTAVPAYIMMSPDFGLAGAVVNRMAYLTVEGKEQEAIYLYRSAFIILTITAAGFVAIGWMIAWFIDWSFLGVKALDHGISVSIIGWSCLQILISQQIFLLSGIYRSARRNPRLGFLGSLNALLILGVSVVLLWQGATPHTYIVGITIATGFTYIVIIYDSRKVMPRFTLGLRGASISVVKPHLVPGLGYAGMPLVNALQNQGVLLVLGAMLGAPSVVIFQTTRVLSNGIKSLLALSTSAIAVEIAALLGEARTALIQRLMIRNTQIGLLLAVIAIISMMFFGEAIYTWWIGPEAVYSNILLLLMLTSNLCVAVSNSLSAYLMGANLIHKTMIPLLFLTLSSLLLTVVAVGVIGITGAGLSLLAWELFVMLLFFKFVTYQIKLTQADYISELVQIDSFCNDLRTLIKKTR